MHSFTYPKAEHLKSRKAIDQLFKSGQSFFVYPYKVIYRIMDNGQLIMDNAGGESMDNGQLIMDNAGGESMDNGQLIMDNAGGESMDKRQWIMDDAGGESDSENCKHDNLSGIINYPLSTIHYPLLSGFAVSTRNFKHAVDRNRIKRLGREAFRLNKQALTEQLVANQLQLQVFFIFTDKKLPDYKLIEPKMQACLKKLIHLTKKHHEKLLQG